MKLHQHLPGKHSCSPTIIMGCHSAWAIPRWFALWSRQLQVAYSQWLQPLTIWLLKCCRCFHLRTLSVGTSSRRLKFLRHLSVVALKQTERLVKPNGVAKNRASLPDWLSLWAWELRTGLRSVVEKVVHCEQIGAPCEDPSVVNLLRIYRRAWPVLQILGGWWANMRVIEGLGWCSD